ncbi:SpoIID/LytB domain-containing protein [Egbenema bharatensis]|uniref:SpoIID/LytB domain-containing protein n=1 Tax=Egbenema bharatensis TaxID=3463334 RepID=UPI003A8B9730
MGQTIGFSTYCVIPTVILRIQIKSNLFGAALLAACLTSLATAKPSTAQEAPLNPILDVGVVQRFGSQPSDSIVIQPEEGDTVTVELKSGEQEQEITTTDEIKIDVVMQALPEPKVTERLVLSTHRSFESAEDSATQWRSKGIEVEIAQPRQWQVWAKRETYGTPLLRRLLMQNLRSHGARNAFIDSQVQQQVPKASLTINGTRLQQDEVTFSTTQNQATVSFNRTDHGRRLYAGTLRLQPNAYGTYTLVNHVPVETYLRGVVPHEIGAGAPPTTIEAQAILARTYALRNLRRFAIDNYQLCADTQCQVYWGLSGAVPETDRAIAATQGQVLTYNNELADALYSSTTGGITAPFEDVWDGEERPYLKAIVDSVQNPWDLSSYPLNDETNFRNFIGRKTGFNEDNWDMFRWRIENSLTDIAGDLRAFLQNKQHPFADFTQVRELKVLERSLAGRVQRIAVTTDRGEIILEKDEILRALYAPNSTLFYLEPIYQPVASPQTEKSVAPAEAPNPTANAAANPTPDSTPAVSPQPTPAPVLKGYAFVGGGFGHGVGMSQTGAYRLGRMGWSNSQILSFYYPNTQLQLLTNAVTFWRDASPEVPGADLDRARN